MTMGKSGTCWETRNVYERATSHAVESSGFVREGARGRWDEDVWGELCQIPLEESEENIVLHTNVHGEVEDERCDAERE